jgi:hypothetical protein
MPSSLNSTILKKGAIVTLQAPNYQQIETTIVFQYNPESLSRTVSANVPRATRGAPSNEILLLKGAPREQINLKVILDGIAKLHEGDKTVLEQGIYPSFLPWNCCSILKVTWLKQRINKLSREC